MTPENWNSNSIATFISTIRGTEGVSIMYDGRIPLLLQILIASRKMQPSSVFYINILGGSIEEKKTRIDIRHLVTRCVLRIAKSQDIVQVMSESEELSKYLLNLVDLKTKVFPVFAPTKFNENFIGLNNSTLILLEDSDSTTFAISEVAHYLENNKSEIMITMCMNKPSNNFIECSNENRDTRLRFVHGYLDPDEYKSLMQENFRHIYVYDSKRYKFRTSGKLMESIALNKSLVIPEQGTFRSLAARFYGSSFLTFSRRKGELSQIIGTPPIKPRQLASWGVEDSVSEMITQGIFSEQIGKKISRLNYLFCFFLLIFVVVSYRINTFIVGKYRS
jgi:hypothetical protein